MSDSRDNVDEHGSWHNQSSIHCVWSRWQVSLRHNCVVERGLVVGFCGQSLYYNRPYYLTTKFRSPSWHVVSAQPLIDRPRSMSCKSAQMGSRLHTRRIMRCRQRNRDKRTSRQWHFRWPCNVPCPSYRSPEHHLCSAASGYAPTMTTLTATQSPLQTFSCDTQRYHSRVVLSSSSSCFITPYRQQHRTYQTQ